MKLFLVLLLTIGLVVSTMAQDAAEEPPADDGAGAEDKNAPAEGDSKPEGTAEEEAGAEGEENTEDKAEAKDDSTDDGKGGSSAIYPAFAVISTTLFALFFSL